MKKFGKALIISVCILSTIGLISYRWQYLKLRHIFEAGGLLDPPPLLGNCYTLNESVSKKYVEANLFSRPINSWIQVNNFHVYSAFMKVRGQTGIALGVAEEKVICPNYKCYIWFSQRGRTVSFGGKFICKVGTVHNSNRFVYEFLCKLDVDIPNQVPIMFVIHDSVRKYLIPIHYREMKQKLNNSAVCIYPDMNAIEAVSVVELLSYHQMIGFSDILIYDSGVQHRTLYLIEKAIQSIQFLRSLSVLQWDFPFDDPALAEEVVRKDCLFRTSGQVELLTYLAWNEYLIPVNNNSALMSLKKYISGKHTKVNADVKICCIDMRDDLKSADKSWPVIFRKTFCLPKEPASKIILDPDIDDEFSLIETPLSEIYINEYVQCTSKQHAYITRDNTVLIYLTNLMQNKLLSIWRSGAFNEVKNLTDGQ